MKQLISLVLGVVVSLNVFAQGDTTDVKVMRKNVVTVIEKGSGTHVKVGNENGVEVITDDWGDTTQIRIGRRTFNVVDNIDGTHVKIEKEDRPRVRPRSFNAHWAGLELGMNMFHQSDYSLYDRMQLDVPNNFMDLHTGKSTTVNLNIFEWAFTNRSKSHGIITGLGFSFMDFAFDQPLTITKRAEDGLLVPVDVNPNGLKKSKLTASYLTAPLMLEIKTPLRMGRSHLYLAGGVIGGVNIGSHTKFKYKGDKEKARSNFNLNKFKYDLTGRVGFGNLCVFVNYSKTPLFENDLGPELYPVTFGVSLLNF